MKGARCDGASCSSPEGLASATALIVAMGSSLGATKAIAPLDALHAPMQLQP